METPFYGYPKMTAHLRLLGYSVSPKRVYRLMRLMDIPAMVPKKHTSKPHPDHKVYPLFAPSGGQSSLEFGHHLRPQASGVHVSCGRDELVQSLCVLLEVIQYAGRDILSGRLGDGIEQRPTRDIQHPMSLS